MDRIKELLLKLEWKHVILLVGLGAAFFYFTLDQSEIENREQALVAANAEVANVERKIQEAQEFEREFEEKRRRYSSLVEEMQKVQGALPKQFFLPDLLSDLLNEAKKLEIEIVKITPDQHDHPHESNLYVSKGFDIQARGTFVQFFIFLDRMAHMGRLVNVQDFRIEPDPNRKQAVLGGQGGAFASANLAGGRTIYPGVVGAFRLITYRYQGTSSPAPTTAANAGGGQ